MNADKDKITKALKTEWQIFKKSTGTTQQEVSKKLGWSVSFFGKILNGNNECSSENLIKICNFLDIPPTRIDPDFNQQIKGLFEIEYTTSGDPPPKDRKMFRPHNHGRVIVWNDVLLEIKSGAKKVSWIPAQTTLICSAEPVVQRSDPSFPLSKTTFWLVIDGKKPVVYAQEQPPKRKGATVLRITAVTFT